MPRMLKNMFITILAVLLLASCDTTGKDPQPGASSNQTGVMTGQRAPDFSLNDLNAKSFRLSDLHGKKPVLLIFWATWCPACIQAIPYFSYLYSQYNPRGLEIIAINIASNDPLPRVRSFQEANKMPYRILYDENNDVSRLYAVFGIPTSIVIDRDGIIQYRGNMLPANVDEFFSRLL